jgi:hypothetical protein
MRAEAATFQSRPCHRPPVRANIAKDARSSNPPRPFQTTVTYVYEAYEGNKKKSIHWNPQLHILISGRVPRGTGGISGDTGGARDGSPAPNSPFARKGLVQHAVTVSLSEHFVRLKWSLHNKHQEIHYRLSDSKCPVP